MPAFAAQRIHQLHRSLDQRRRFVDFLNRLGSIGTGDHHLISPASRSVAADLVPQLFSIAIEKPNHGPPTIQRNTVCRERTNFVISGSVRYLSLLSRQLSLLSGIGTEVRTYRPARRSASALVFRRRGRRALQRATESGRLSCSTQPPGAAPRISSPSPARRDRPCPRSSRAWAGTERRRARCDRANIAGGTRTVQGYPRSRIPESRTGPP